MSEERAEAQVLRDPLVAWFRRHARRMPWRDDPTPYHVLLSELMLQQTRVDTVIPYFEAFTKRWPTLEDLAAAGEEEILEAWAGLGYYRRARNLHAAAKAAVAAGGLPADVDALRALPGIGPYTAGAIASIAFGLPVPAVDGNVERVISRVDGRHEDPKKAVGRRALAQRVGEITHADVASEVTQGLMELGATVCTPKRARCGACPWQGWCVARADDLVDQLPRLAARKKPKRVHAVAGILVGPEGILMGRRPPGLLGGLWEPVMGDWDGTSDPAAAVREAFATRARLAVEVLRPLGQVVHVFTHRRLTVQIFEVVAGSAPCPTLGDPSYEALGWWRDGAEGMGLSKLSRKLLIAHDTPGLPLAAEPRFGDRGDAGGVSG